VMQGGLGCARREDCGAGQGRQDRGGYDRE